MKTGMDSANGANGDPTLADKKKGEIILQAMVDDLVTFIDGFKIEK